MTSKASSTTTRMPFSEAEYDRRWEAVLCRFDEFEVDAVISTFGCNQQYLTGHNAFGAYAAPFYLIIAPGKPRTYVVRRFNVRTVETEAIPLEIHSYVQVDDAAKVCADVIRSLGLDRARIGLELDLLGVTPRDVANLQRLLPDVEVVDVSRLILTLADIKSQEEITLTRAAMKATEAGMAAFFDLLKEGVTDTECFDAITTAVEATGATSDCLLAFGARSGMGGVGQHPVGDRLEHGEIAYLEGGGYVHDYAAALVRSAICGRNPEAEALYELSNEALEAAIAAARPGALAGDVDRAARDVVERSSFPEALNHRVGYSIGLNWCVRGCTSLEPGAQDVIHPNMTFHMPMILFAPESRFAFGCSETIRVTTEGRAEILSSFSRELRFI